MNSEINIFDLIAILLKKWWLIAIITILTASAAYGYSRYVLRPTYTSQGLLYVNNLNNMNNVVTAQKNVDYSNLVASYRLATIYIEILQSDTFLKSVNDSAGLSLTPARMRSLITITSKNDTEILEVTATHTNPATATNIVEKVLENSNDELTRIFKGGSVEIIDHAIPPRRPSGPNIIMNSFMGLLLGLISGILFVLILNFFDDRIKGQDDLAIHYNIPVLGMIPGIRRASRNAYYSKYDKKRAYV